MYYSNYFFDKIYPFTGSI